MECDASGAGIALDALPPVTRSWVVAALESDEMVFWVSQPCEGIARQRGWRHMGMGAAVLCTLWLLFGGPMVSGLSHAWSRPGDKPFLSYLFQVLLSLFAILLPMVTLSAVSLKALLAPWWLPAQARATAYVITDRRALLLLPNAIGSRAHREEYRAPQLVAAGHFFVDAFPASVHVVLSRTWVTSETGDAPIDHGFLYLTRTDAGSASQCLQSRLQSPVVVTPSSGNTPSA